MNIDILSTIRNVSADLTQFETIAVVFEWKFRHCICNGTALKTFIDTSSSLRFKVLGFIQIVLITRGFILLIQNPY